MLTGYEIELVEIGGSTVTTENEAGETVVKESNPDAMKALFGDDEED
jgi:acyl-coenzyme A synthetase/AMP-(fatty) acid ligase